MFTAAPEDRVGSYVRIATDRSQVVHYILLSSAAAVQSQMDHRQGHELDICGTP
jgi:hypothetical protein